MRLEDLRKIVGYMYKDEAKSFAEMLSDNDLVKESDIPSGHDQNEFYTWCESEALSRADECDHIFINVVAIKRFVDEAD